LKLALPFLKKKGHLSWKDLTYWESDFPHLILKACPSAKRSTFHEETYISYEAMEKMKDIESTKVTTWHIGKLN
jgi:hypothetical protein